MKRVCLFVFALALFSVARAEWSATGFERIQVSNGSTVTLTSGTIPTSNFEDGVRASMTVESSTTGVRYTLYASTAPSATFGHLAQSNSFLTITGYGNLRALKFFNLDTSTSTVWVTYESRK